MTQRGTPLYRRAVAGLLLIAIATFGLIYVVQPTFALVSAEFATSASTTSLLLSVTTFVIALSVLPAARLSSRVGRGRYMAMSLALAVVATAVAALAPSMTVLLALRALAGLGFAGVTGVALAWVADEASPLDGARLGGLYIAGTTIGGMAGRLAGGVAADVAGWRGALGLLALLAALCAALGVALLPRRGQMADARRRIRSRAAADGAADDADTTASALDSREAPEAEDPGRPGFEDVDGTPPPGHARAVPRATLPLLFAIGFLGMFAFVGVFSAIVFRAAEPPMSMGPAATSLFFLTYLAGTASSAVAGAVSARIGLRRAMLTGLLVAIAGVLLTLAPSSLTIWLGLAVMSAGFFLAHALASAAGPRLATRPGAASSTYTLCYYLGSSVGGVVLGKAWDDAGWGAVVLGAVGVFALAAAAAVAVRPPAKPAVVAP